VLDHAQVWNWSRLASTSLQRWQDYLTQQEAVPAHFHSVTELSNEMTRTYNITHSSGLLPIETEVLSVILKPLPKQVLWCSATTKPTIFDLNSKWVQSTAGTRHRISSYKTYRRNPLREKIFCAQIFPLPLPSHAGENALSQRKGEKQHDKSYTI